MEKTQEAERPIKDEDIPSLNAVVRLIQRMYQLTFPGSFERYLWVAQQNGVLI